MLQFGDKDTEESILTRVNAEQGQDEVAGQLNELIEKIMEVKKNKEKEVKKKINEKLEQAEQEEAERQRKVQEEEEEAKRREEEGAGEEQQPKKEENKVEKPEPATERVPLKEPNVSNIDNDFKPTIIKVWEELSSTYKSQMKRVFR